MERLTFWGEEQKSATLRLDSPPLVIFSTTKHILGKLRTHFWHPSCHHVRIRCVAWLEVLFEVSGCWAAVSQPLFELWGSSDRWTLGQLWHESAHWRLACCDLLKLFQTVASCDFDCCVHVFLVLHWPNRGDWKMCVRHFQRRPSSLS